MFTNRQTQWDGMARVVRRYAGPEARQSREETAAKRTPVRSLGARPRQITKKSAFVRLRLVPRVAKWTLATGPVSSRSKKSMPVSVS